MQSAVTVGVSLGAAVGGALSAQSGATAAFGLAVLADITIVVTALVMRRTEATTGACHPLVQLDSTSARR